MDRIQAARVFVEIVERGSMVAAAEYLDMSRSMVTRYLTEIEHWANARLLHRSTRRLSLTPAGEVILKQCQQLLALADDIPQQQPITEAQISGNLRIATANYAAEHILLPVLQSYLQDYPQVNVELHISNATVDLVEQRMDLALRITPELDPNLIALPLGQCASVMCASPQYLQRHGTPNSLEQLQQHQCLIFSHFGRHALWHFNDADAEPSNNAGTTRAIAVHGNLVASDAEILLKAAARHMGIGYQPAADAQPLIDRGELVEILPQYRPRDLGIYGVYRSRKQMPPALRLLLDRLRENYRGC